MQRSTDSSSRGRVSIIAALTLYALWVSPNAYAYIDGGTASMMFQMLIGGLVAASLFLRSFWAIAKARVANLFSGADPIEADPAPAEQSSTIDD